MSPGRVGLRVPIEYNAPLLKSYLLWPSACRPLSTYANRYMSTPYSPQHQWMEWLVDVQTTTHGCDCLYTYIPLDWVLQHSCVVLLSFEYGKTLNCLCPKVGHVQVVWVDFDCP